MKTILDPCCGSRIFWFDKKDGRAGLTDDEVVALRDYLIIHYPIEARMDLECGE